jgi:uncharacterized membrane protein
MSSQTEIDKAKAEALAFFAATDRIDAPTFTKTIQPYRSLPIKGFVWLIAIACIGFLIPLLAFIGSKVLWGLLIPCLITLATLWYFIQRNYRDAEVQEIIKLWPDLLAIQRINPQGPDQFWQANPHWVKLHIKDTPEIEGYLTITGGTREIELGAFLTPDQRNELRYRIEKAIRQVNN